MIAVTKPLMDWEHDQAEVMKPEIVRVESERKARVAQIEAFRKKATHGKENSVNFVNEIREIADLEVDLPEVPKAPRERSDDTFGLAGVLSGASHQNQEFLEAGGLGILAGDGALTYGSEKVVETYYDLPIWKIIHVALDYQFVSNPAFNRDRGPVSVFGARLHWEL
jgi:hypothetical protein